MTNYQKYSTIHNATSTFKPSKGRDKMTEETKWYIDHKEPTDIWENIEVILSGETDYTGAITCAFRRGEPRPNYFKEIDRNLLEWGLCPKELLLFNSQSYLEDIKTPEDLEEKIQMYILFGLEREYVEKVLKDQIYY